MYIGTETAPKVVNVKDRIIGTWNCPKVFRRISGGITEDVFCNEKRRNDYQSVL